MSERPLFRYHIAIYFPPENLEQHSKCVHKLSFQHLSVECKCCIAFFFAFSLTLKWGGGFVDTWNFRYGILSWTYVQSLVPMSWCLLELSHDKQTVCQMDPLNQRPYSSWSIKSFCFKKAQICFNSSMCLE